MNWVVSSHTNLYVEDLTPFKEVVKVKLSYQGGALIW